MNEFAAVDIHLPEKFQPYFRTYCLTRTEGSRNLPQHSPFPRMVDMWFMAICLAVKNDLKPDFESSGKTYKAIDGAVFSSDTWRSNALMLLAIAYAGEIKIADKPQDMMRIVNAYAIAGLPELITILENRGGDEALDHFSDVVSDMIS